jgi:hypothetical protein
VAGVLLVRNRPVLTAKKKLISRECFQIRILSRTLLYEGRAFFTIENGTFSGIVFADVVSNDDKEKIRFARTNCLVETRLNSSTNFSSTISEVISTLPFRLPIFLCALVLSCGQRVPKGVRLYRACSARADLYITDI